MTIETHESLPEELRLALAYTPVPLRPKLESYFALDQRLGQLVAKASEPILRQMRLAWWRDMLSIPRDGRPKGDAVLDAIGEHWSGNEIALKPLIDVWELLVAEEELTPEIVRQFADGRSVPISSVGDDLPGVLRDRVRLAGTRWAIADAASKTSGKEERGTFIAVGSEAGPSKDGLPRALRGIAILEALALRSLKRGGRPLMEGRGAAAIALRVGLLGR